MWTERYRPKELDDIAGNGDGAKKLGAWLGKWKPGAKAALLIGPPGSGKTTTVQLFAARAGLNLVELNASDTRTKEKLRKRLGEALSTTSLFGNRSLIFLDEVDGLAGRSDYGAIDFIKEAVRTSENPVVMSANNPEAGEVRKLASATVKITFRRLTLEEVIERLRAIARSEKMEAADGELEEIAESANGDMRAAINSLQSGIPGKRDEELTAVESVNSFFSAHDRKTALSAIRAHPGQPRDKVRDLFHAVVKAKILEERKVNALEVLSRADVLIGRIVRAQQWRMLRYLDPMLSTELWEAVGDGGASYTFDAAPWPLQVRIWNDSRKLKDIAAATGKRLGVSAKGSLVGDVPFLMRLCADRGFREQFAKSLSLEENYVMFIEKESRRY